MQTSINFDTNRSILITSVVKRTPKSCSSKSLDNVVKYDFGVGGSPPSNSTLKLYVVKGKVTEKNENSVIINSRLFKSTLHLVTSSCKCWCFFLPWKKLQLGRLLDQLLSIFWLSDNQYSLSICWWNKRITSAKEVMFFNPCPFLWRLTAVSWRKTQ